MIGGVNHEHEEHYAIEQPGAGRFLAGPAAFGEAREEDRRADGNPPDRGVQTSHPQGFAKRRKPQAMNRDVKAIAGRLNLRSPPRKDADVATALEVIRSDFPLVTGFEREFPSLCFERAIVNCGV